MSTLRPGAATSFSPNSSVMREGVLKSRQNIVSLSAKSLSTVCGTLSYRIIRSMPGIHLRKSGNWSGTTILAIFPCLLRYSAHVRHEPIASPSALTWPRISTRSASATISRSRAKSASFSMFKFIFSFFCEKKEAMEASY